MPRRTDQTDHQHQPSEEEIRAVVHLYSEYGLISLRHRQGILYGLGVGDMNISETDSDDTGEEEFIEPNTMVEDIMRVTRSGSPTVGVPSRENDDASQTNERMTFLLQQIVELNKDLSVSINVLFRRCVIRRTLVRVLHSVQRKLEDQQKRMIRRAMQHSPIYF